jgi:hypothetical protein
MVPTMIAEVPGWRGRRGISGEISDAAPRSSSPKIALAGLAHEPDASCVSDSSLGPKRFGRPESRNLVSSEGARAAISMDTQTLLENGVCVNDESRYDS